MKLQLVLLFLFTLSLVAAEPYLESSMDRNWEACNEFKIMQKTFTATAPTISAGVLCPDNSRVEMYDCSQGNCIYYAQGYKVNGTLPTFAGFDVGQRYSYQCYACEGTCAVTYKEGQAVNLRSNFAGLSFNVLESQAPLKMDGSWQTTFDDAGDYTTTVLLQDEHESDTATFCLQVQDVGRTPILTLEKKTLRVKEGDVVALKARCSDPDGTLTHLEYSGWMQTDTKETSFTDQGQHEVTVTCSDEDAQVVSENITVIVADQNRAPRIERILSYTS